MPTKPRERWRRDVIEYVKERYRDGKMYHSLVVMRLDILKAFPIRPAKLTIRLVDSWDYQARKELLWDEGNLIPPPNGSIGYERIPNAPVRVREKSLEQLERETITRINTITKMTGVAATQVDATVDELLRYEFWAGMYRYAQRTPLPVAVSWVKSNDPSEGLARATTPNDHGNGTGSDR